MQHDINKQSPYDTLRTAISRMQTITVLLALIAAFAIITEFVS